MNVSKSTTLGALGALGVTLAIIAPATVAAAPQSAPPDSHVAGTIPDPAACAAGKTLEDDVLTIATGDPAYPPYVLDDDPTSGEGFEAAVAYAIAEQLGFGPDQVEWVRSGFDAAIAPGPKDWDFNLQQYGITEERAKIVAFSLPYYVATQALIGYEDSPAAGAGALADLQDLRLGAATGTTSLVFAEDIIAPAGGVQVFNSNADAVASLQAQQLDAIVVDLPTALYLAVAGSDDGGLGDGATIFGQFTTTDDTAGEPWGLLFEQDNPLVECADNAILALRDSGELDAITEEWMTSSIDVPFIDLDG